MVNQRGITLIEVLVSVVIVGLVVGVLPFVTQTLRTSNRSESETVANFIAQARLEALLNTPYEQIQPTSSAVVDTTYPDFSYSVTVAPVTRRYGSLSIPLKKVRVEVSYTGSKVHVPPTIVESWIAKR